TIPRVRGVDRALNFLLPDPMDPRRPSSEIGWSTREARSASDPVTQKVQKRGTAMRIAKRSRFPGGWTICALSGLALTACGRGGGASSHSISSTPTAAPTTSVGSGSAVGPSSTEGPEPFVSPVGVAVDTLGNVYVADYGNDQIRRIATSGVVTTVAGSRNAGDADGTGTTASFHFPEGV